MRKKVSVRGRITWNVKGMRKFVLVLYKKLADSVSSLEALVTKVKVYALKMRKKVSVRGRTTWNVNVNVKDMRKFVSALYKKSADSVSPLEEFGACGM